MGSIWGCLLNALKICQSFQQIRRPFNYNPFNIPGLVLVHHHKLTNFHRRSQHSWCAFPNVVWHTSFNQSNIPVSHSKWVLLKQKLRVTQLQIHKVWRQVHMFWASSLRTKTKFFHPSLKFPYLSFILYYRHICLPQILISPSSDADTSSFELFFITIW